MVCENGWPSPGWYESVGFIGPTTGFGRYTFIDEMIRQGKAKPYEGNRYWGLYDSKELLKIRHPSNKAAFLSTLGTHIIMESARKGGNDENDSETDIPKAGR